MGKRMFRCPESYEAERITRDMLPSFLKDRGFTVENDIREDQGQTITGVSPEGEFVSMRVRLCWRRGTDARDSERVRRRSAAQFMARIHNNDWIASLQSKVDRYAMSGVTHLLIVQRDGERIEYAALIPLPELIAIWMNQRDVSTRLIQEGKLGRRKKNHAMNGKSPTIWLQDDTGGEEVAAALWNHRGVQNIVAFPSISSESLLSEEIIDSSLYVEGACRRVFVNAYERDEHARRQCIACYGANCYICGFSFGSVYGKEAEGYIHVHHLKPLSEIGREYVVNPIEDLRPVCPNCHAMLHLRRVSLTPEDLKERIDRNRQV